MAAAKHDPVADWRAIKNSLLKVDLRNEGEFYAGSSSIRLFRTRFGLWLLHVTPLNDRFQPAGAGVYLSVGPSIIDELKKVGIPIYLEDL